MPRPIKLTSALQRAWRENTSQWVSPQGVVLRAVTPEEEKALFPAVQNARRVGRNGRQTVVAEYVRVDESNTRHVQNVTLDVQFVVTRTGNAPDAFLLDVFVAGNRYVSGREIIEKRLLAQHGECILHGVNGKRIKVIRDPNVTRPKFSEARTTPPPDNCVCRGWIGTEPGRHHHTCTFNAYAPPSEKASVTVADQGVFQTDGSPIPALAFDAAPIGNREAMPTAPNAAPMPGVPGAPLHRSSAAPPPPLPDARIPTSTLTDGARAAAAAPMADVPFVDPTERATRSAVAVPVPPSECENDCRGLRSGTTGWAWPTGRRAEKNQHHPMCKFYENWRRHAAGEKAMVLFDWDTMQPVREATADEVAQSEVAEARTGTPSVLVGDKRYAVVPRDGKIPDRKPPARPDVVLEGSRLASLAKEAPSESDLEAERAARVQDERRRKAEEAAALRARHQAAAESGLPEVPGSPSRVAESETALRDERGLVGDQRGDGTIEAGPAPGLGFSPLTASMPTPARVERGVVTPEPKPAAQPPPPPDPEAAALLALLERLARKETRLADLSIEQVAKLEAGGHVLEGTTEMMRQARGIVEDEGEGGEEPSAPEPEPESTAPTAPPVGRDETREITAEAAG